jgi:hypothetical protein
MKCDRCGVVEARWYLIENVMWCRLCSRCAARVARRYLLEQIEGEPPIRGAYALTTVEAFV